METINGQDLYCRLNNGENLNLLDVRKEIEYHTYNIGGQNIPLSRLQQSADQVRYNKTDEIIVICKMGIRSKTAQIILEENGYKYVNNLAGGLLAIQKMKNKIKS